MSKVTIFGNLDSLLVKIKQEEVSAADLESGYYLFQCTSNYFFNVTPEFGSALDEARKKSLENEYLYLAPYVRTAEKSDRLVWRAIDTPRQSLFGVNRLLGWAKLPPAADIADLRSREDINYIT